jgi:SAM-dependent methyltransferase
MTEPRQERLLAKCPACGSRSISSFDAPANLHRSRCSVCGLLFLNPQPLERVRHKYLYELDLAEHFRTRAARKRVLFTRRVEQLPAPASGAHRLCDVGCADGLFLEVARDAGWEGCGIELNPPAAARARERGFLVYEGAFPQEPLAPAGSFDLVTAWDSLEHAEDPLAFVRGLARLLAPAGHLVLSTLNSRSLVSRVFRHRWSMIAEDHFTYWDRRSLSHLFASLGLPATRVHSWGLGRDFFAPLDRLAARRPRSPGSERPAEAVETWDVGRGTLAAESTVNRLLSATGLGVDLCVTARRGE